ncbi:hypothetical protein OHA84_12555 [Streptomyces sp. NBC_00513]|uniref:hypothetical protein n=1 Tax=unclassified Streptomyces TaxID=2593676 RepID=UPI0022522E93|nr:hypothetical protein [Streptomyces sp. NBC_00424]MCX5075618.1 hypothetical protein [Streptomyces sp. NBC_00424]WUD41282.1 hypothetical protein OHA84_12555 [Streptomyces sp. NBC_00513]
MSPTYRDAEWFGATGIESIIGKIDELNHLVSDGTLKARLALVVTSGEVMFRSVTHPHHGPERRVSVVTRQAGLANELHERAKAALVETRRQL